MYARIYNSRNFNLVWNEVRSDLSELIYNSRNFNLVWNVGSEDDMTKSTTVEILI